MTTDVMERLQSVKDNADQRRQSATESNRALMPKVTEFVDAIREEFGECKVTYASEGGVTKGRPFDEKANERKAA